MPLVDGVASVRLIRAFEKENSPPCLQKAQSYGRIPIIAVSASLSEQAWSDYIDCGFDGWILKLKWVGCIAKNVERPTSTTGTVALEGE
jgi:hypothetical protein